MATDELHLGAYSYAHGSAVAELVGIHTPPGWNVEALAQPVVVTLWWPYVSPRCRAALAQSLASQGQGPYGMGISCIHWLRNVNSGK